MLTSAVFLAVLAFIFWAVLMLLSLLIIRYSFTAVSKTNTQGKFLLALHSFSLFYGIFFKFDLVLYICSFLAVLAFIFWAILMLLSLLIIRYSFIAVSKTNTQGKFLLALHSFSLFYGIFFQIWPYTNLTACLVLEQPLNISMLYRVVFTRHRFWWALWPGFSRYDICTGVTFHVVEGCFVHRCNKHSE